jgi:hypothetical protein
MALLSFVLAAIGGMVQAPLSAAQEPPQASTQPGMQQAESPADPHTEEERAAERQALGFLGYLDHGRFADSYAYTGMLIRTQLDRAAFAKQLEKARAGTGAMLTRSLIDVSYTTTVPGAPEGQYVLLHYGSSFANRQEAVETVTLDFAKGYWRVVGYYIK